MALFVRSLSSSPPSHGPRLRPSLLRSRCRFMSSGSSRWNVRVSSSSSSPSPSPSSSSSSSSSLESVVSSLKWDEKGMLVAIAQDADTGMILMQAFANKDAVMNTVTSRKATWYSRSRDKLWIKGEESGNFIEVTSVYADCDGDSVIYLGKPRGPSCHTGAQTCYYTQLDGPDGAIANNQVKEHKKDFAHTHEHGAGAAPTATPTLLALQRTIADRANEPVVEGTKPSWTRRLLSNHELLCSKVREEADELCQALEKNEGVERATSEFGDVLYHSLVLLHAAGGDVNDALATLRARFNQSGVEEKASRK